MGSYLAETIESVLACLQPGDEYFVIDGGSTDNSVEIIRRYQAHLAGWVSEPDRGYADAIAKGFERSSGQYMCWINSGDLLLNNALRAARTALVQTDADLIFGDDVYVDEHGRVLAHSRAHVRSLQHMMLYGGWTPLQDACFWRRALYDKAGGLDASFKLAADYDLFLRMSWCGRAVYVPSIFSAFRRHANQQSIGQNHAYEVERERARRRMLAALNVPAWKRLAYESLYFVLVRWRHHIAVRLSRPAVALGTSAKLLVNG